MHLPRYLIVAPQGLGDSLEATPFIAALKAAQPSAVVDVVVTRLQAKSLFEGLQHLVDDVIYLPFWDSGPAAFVKALLLKRWRQRYDAAFLMYPSTRREYQLLMRAFPARRRFSHRYFDENLKSMLFLNTDLVNIGAKHNVLRNLDLLTAAGIGHDIPDRYTVPKSWIERTDPEHGEIVIHVGTIAHDGLEARRWPLENFIDVARTLVAKGHCVTALLGPAEREQTLELQKRVPQVKIFEGSLEQAGRFLSAARIVLTNDSGIGHLAVAVGAPTISLFGPTPLEHAPYGPTGVALRPSACLPCFDPRDLRRGCALNINYRCLREDFPPELVLNAINNLLAPRSLQTP